MILEQSNDRLTIQKKETRPTVGWLILFLGIGIGILSYRISATWITSLCIFVVGMMVLIAPSKILEPRFFIFDRIQGEITVLYQIRVIRWKIEWKKVHALQDLKDVVLMTYKSDKYTSVSYYTELVIQRNPNKKNSTDKRVQIPGEWEDFRTTQAEAKSVASFLGLNYKVETRIVNRVDY